MKELLLAKFFGGYSPQIKGQSVLFSEDLPRRTIDPAPK